MSPHQVEEDSKKIFDAQQTKPCPQCGQLMPDSMPGGRDAVCKNCGFKDPCCGD